VNTIGYYPANTVLRVTSTTNKTTGKTDLAVYSVNSSGAVVALLGSITLYAEVIGDRAGVFVIGGGNIQTQPYAIYP
jgi:phosphohistidine swiveling domain-containing protein